MAGERRRKHFGWGCQGEGWSAEERAFAFARISELLGVPSFDRREPPRLDEIALRAP
jgi:alkyldihydroxyacetonephosphate synthase